MLVLSVYFKAKVHVFFCQQQNLKALSQYNVLANAEIELKDNQRKPMLNVLVTYS